jgi:hypothetical protein
LTVRTKEGTTNACHEASAEKIIVKLREVEIMLGRGDTTAVAPRIADSEQTYMDGARNTVARRRIRRGGRRIWRRECMALIVRAMLVSATARSRHFRERAAPVAAVAVRNSTT